MKHYSVYAIILILLLSTFTEASGQMYKECGFQEPFFVKVEQSSIFNGSLKEYFEKQLNGKIKNHYDPIQVQILIDTTGKACCMSVQNNNSSISSLEIKTVINSMPTWKPAKHNNRVVSFAVILRLVIKDSMVEVNYVNEKMILTNPGLNKNTTNNFD